MRIAATRVRRMRHGTARPPAPFSCNTHCTYARTNRHINMHGKQLCMCMHTHKRKHVLRTCACACAYPCACACPCACTSISICACACACACTSTCACAVHAHAPVLVHVHAHVCIMHHSPESHAHQGSPRSAGPRRASPLSVRRGPSSPPGPSAATHSPPSAIAPQPPCEGE